jgi:hypothetical protein
MVMLREPDRAIQAGVLQFPPFEFRHFGESPQSLRSRSLTTFQLKVSGSFQSICLNFQDLGQTVPINFGKRIDRD